MGYKILIIQIEAYSGVNSKKINKFTAWNIINVGKQIYNKFIYVMIYSTPQGLLAALHLEFVTSSNKQKKPSLESMHEFSLCI